MSSNLYEILGLQRDATADQGMSKPCPRSLSPPPQCSRLFAVRKAYRKRALETHPDRVPPEEKEIAGDEFRKVTLFHAIHSITTLIRDLF
jgi:curved DNA-binding protein CbpA